MSIYALASDAVARANDSRRLNRGGENENIDDPRIATTDDAPLPPTPASDALSQLAKFFPSEIVAIYLLGLAALNSYVPPRVQAQVEVEIERIEASGPVTAAAASDVAVANAIKARQRQIEDLRKGLEKRQEDEAKVYGRILFIGLILLTPLLMHLIYRAKAKALSNAAAFAVTISEAKWKFYAAPSAFAIWALATPGNLIVGGSENILYAFFALVLSIMFTAYDSSTNAKMPTT